MTLQVWQDLLASSSDDEMDGKGSQVGPGRTVLLVGEGARQRAALLMHTMQASSCQPAVVAAVSDIHLAERLAAAVSRVR